jgi:hypothetical protein
MMDKLIQVEDLWTRLANRPRDFLLTTGEAAVYLRHSPKTLANWRSAGAPPKYVQFAGEGTSGARVLYELGDLQDLVASRKRGSTSDVLAFASNGIESRFHMASGGALLPEDDSDGGAPFFVNASVPGLVLAQCYETNRYLDAWLTDRTIDVAWLNWDEALAAVWEDEPRCQSWLQFADRKAPGFAALVHRKRVEKLI